MLKGRAILEYTDALRIVVNSLDIVKSSTAGKLLAFKIHAYDWFSNHRHEGGDPSEVFMLSPVFKDCTECCSCTAGSPFVSFSNAYCNNTDVVAEHKVCSPCPNQTTGLLDL